MFSNQNAAEWQRLCADLEREGFGDLTEAELHLSNPCHPESFCTICSPDCDPLFDDHKVEEEPREPVMSEQTGFCS